MRHATHPLIYPDTVEDREYQLRIAEAASDRNTLVVLPTALGKTPPDVREAVGNGASRVVFATPQVVKNDVLLKGLSLRDFGLLVFDECHRAVKEYAYTEVAQQYVKQSDYPLILGMTASPGSDAERVRAVS